MPNSEVKETLCARCAHREVCIYKQDFIDIIKAVENIVSKKVTQYDFISGITVGCKYYYCK